MRPQLDPVQLGKPGSVKPDLSEPELPSQGVASPRQRRQTGGIPPSVTAAQRGSAEGPGSVGEGGGGGATAASGICLWWVSVEWDSLPCNDPSTS